MRIGVAAAAIFLATAARAADSGAPQNSAVPTMPTPVEVDRSMDALGRAINAPVTGAASSPRVTGGGRPPSLEALQALRPGTLPTEGAEGMRAAAVCQEGQRYGAAGGLAARSFSITEMLRRYEDRLDVAFDARGLLIPTGTGRTALRPPVVSEQQMAWALDPNGGQQARETGRIYQITRRGALINASTPPNWRTYLVPVWAPPTPGHEATRPRTDKEAAIWKRCVAEGWAEGERLGTENFLQSLATLESDIIGMARFHVLNNAGLVEPPKVAVRHIQVQGGGSDMRLNDTTITITNQPGLNGNQRRWRTTAPGVGTDSPIGAVRQR